MKKERLQEILKRLEESPELPLMMLIDHEALEAFEQVLRHYPRAHLVMMQGVRYITITDAALEYILERLEREKAQFVTTVERYNRDIAGVSSLIESRNKYYWSESCVVPPPAFVKSE